MRIDPFIVKWRFIEMLIRALVLLAGLVCGPAVLERIEQTSWRSLLLLQPATFMVVSGVLVLAGVLYRRGCESYLWWGLLWADLVERSLISMGGMCIAAAQILTNSLTDFQQIEFSFALVFVSVILPVSQHGRILVIDGYKEARRENMSRREPAVSGIPARSKP